MLLLGPGGRRVLLLGNECMGYTSVLAVPVEPILCQSLSLGGQPRATAPRMRDVLAQVGVSAGQKVSVVGWKYLDATETDEPTAPAFVPAFLVDVLRSLVGPGGQLVDGTALLMHPEHGLRSLNGGRWRARPPRLPHSNGPLAMLLRPCSACCATRVRG